MDDESTYFDVLREPIQDKSYRVPPTPHRNKVSVIDEALQHQKGKAGEWMKDFEEEAGRPVETVGTLGSLTRRG